MSKYLIQANYVGEGVQGIINEGGTGRRKALEKAAEATGGRVEAMYFAFGETDVFCIVNFPDNVTALAGSLVGNASGRVKATYTPLMTPEDVDRAAGKAKQVTDAYRPPGS